MKMEAAADEQQQNAQRKKIPEPNYFKPISWFRAPYYAASQMAYLESHEEMLHAVCGGCDLLMFGGEKVILNIDFKTASYEVTDLDQVLYALGVSDDPYCFVDTCLLSGFDASRTFEPLTLTKLRDELKQNKEKETDSNSKKTTNKKGHSRRNFSYQHSLEQVLKRGSGLAVINEYLCTFNDDVHSVRSYHTNWTESTVMTRASKRSVRSAMTAKIYNRPAPPGSSAGSADHRDGNIDKILQHMLGNGDDEKNGHANGNVEDGTKE